MISQKSCSSERCFEPKVSDFVFGFEHLLGITPGCVCTDPNVFLPDMIAGGIIMVCLTVHNEKVEEEKKRKHGVE